MTAGGAPTAGAGDEASDEGSFSEGAEKVDSGSEEIDADAGESNRFPHCDYNFVANTTYKLNMDINGEEVVWGEAQFDPQPAVPSTHEDDYRPGDFVLIKGSDIKLTKRGKGGKGGKGKPRRQLVFDVQDQLIMTKEWDNFEDEMSTEDLVNLGEETFLLWWQNVQQPKNTIPRKTKPAGKTKKWLCGFRFRFRLSFRFRAWIINN